MCRSRAVPAWGVLSRPRVHLCIVLSLGAFGLSCNEQHAATHPVSVTVPESSRDTSFPNDRNMGVDPFSSPGLWVIDAQDQLVGRLVRRGSDDSRARSALYDRVQVYHPPSGLFFDVTMSDAQVRVPAKVYFKGASCAEPLGVAVGACSECRSGYGVAFLHDQTWYQVRGGQLAQVTPNDASLDMGVSATCVPHSSSSTRAFQVEEVVAAAPPGRFFPPLRFHGQ